MRRAQTLVWRTVAKLHNRKLEETPVVLENVSFRRATIMSRDAPLRFLVNVLDATGEFVVCEAGAAVVTGTVRLLQDPAQELLAFDDDDDDDVADPDEVNASPLRNTRSVVIGWDIFVPIQNVTSEHLLLSYGTKYVRVTIARSQLVIRTC